MKRTQLKRGTSQMKRTKFRVKGYSDPKDVKQEIQDTVRLIVTARDGGCILRKFRCGVKAYVENGKVVSDTVIQADHLITRSNSATYADTRLIVCVCKGCHGWKLWNEKAYEALVRSILPEERLRLWDRAEADHQAHRTHKMDWKMELIALKVELNRVL